MIFLREVQMFSLFFSFFDVLSIILIRRDVYCLYVQSIILIIREGRVRSLHTLYTLCDTLSPHPPLVIMIIMMTTMMMMMMLITMMRMKDMIP